MKDTDLVHFIPSDQIFKEAEAIFNTQKEILEKLLPEADIQHVGSCAILGALAKFDIDIQIRVSEDNFKKTVEIMNNNFIQKHPELWTEQFSIFKNDNNPPIDYVVTVIDSRHDDFYRVRDYFVTHPDLLQQYNDMKKMYEGKPYAEYRKAKMEFLGGNGSVRFLKY